MSTNKTKENKISIKNLWLLVLYAKKFEPLLDVKKIKSEKNPEKIPDLIAEILADTVERRLRRNLSSELRYSQGDLTRVRGRINHIRTESLCLLQRGKISCRFDEFTTDTTKNRFVKAALRKLILLVKENDDLNQRCRAAVAALERAGVLKDRHNIDRWSNLASVTNVRANTEDRQMLAAARLVHEWGLPTEESGSLSFRKPSKEVQLWQLFEDAVGGFYETVLAPKGWKVKMGNRTKWQYEPDTEKIKDILPGMQTDIVLISPDKKSRTIIDTKFMSIVIKRSDHKKDTLRSLHIYQMYAYLRSQEKHDDESSLTSSGLLLYPSTGKEFDESCTIQRHRIRFATVNLADDIENIRHRLCFLALSKKPQPANSKSSA